jgi:hypothetical protein
MTIVLTQIGEAYEATPHIRHRASWRKRLSLVTATPVSEIPDAHLVRLCCRRLSGRREKQTAQQKRERTATRKERIEAHAYSEGSA